MRKYIFVLLAIATFSFGFTPKSASAKKELSKRYVTQCGFLNGGAAHQAAINVPISPLEIRSEIVVVNNGYAGENAPNYCYSFWVISLV